MMSNYDEINLPVKDMWKITKKQKIRRMALLETLITNTKLLIKSYEEEYKKLEQELDEAK